MFHEFGDRFPVSILGGDATVDDGGAPGAQTSTAFTTAVERAAKSSVQRSPVTKTVSAQLAHGALVKDYTDFVLQQCGRHLVGRSYTVTGLHTPLGTDIVDLTRGFLFEARPELMITELYRAVGQFDVHRQLAALG